MGLDVYLKKCADLATADRLEAEYETKSTAIWDAVGVAYDLMTTEQRESSRTQCEALASALGLDEYGEHPERQRVEIDSAIDPEHMFKIGYFRSSYNEGGINRILRNLNQPDLAGIMGAPDDGSNFVPDWEASLERVNGVIAAYEQHIHGAMGKYGIREEAPMWEFGAPNMSDALALFQQALERSAEGGGRNYSNRDGLFHLDGIKVCAVITKTFTPPRTGSPLDALLNRPSVFLVYEKEANDKPDWYLTALQIVRETIEYVIAQPDRQHFYMVWSG